MDAKWIRSELEQNTGTVLWRASWASPDYRQALIHQYFFEAPNIEAAHAKVFTWMMMPKHLLSNNARIVQERWCSPQLSNGVLPIWRVSWIESKEKHTLLFFEPPDYEGAVRRARKWARQRYETLEDFQMLSRLGGTQLYQAWFDPEEGKPVAAF